MEKTNIILKMHQAALVLARFLPLILVETLLLRFDHHDGVDRGRLVVHPLEPADASGASRVQLGLLLDLGLLQLRLCILSRWLVRYSGGWLLNLTICSLIVIGGIGFPVLFDLQAWFPGRKMRKPRLSVEKLK